MSQPLYKQADHREQTTKDQGGPVPSAIPPLGSSRLHTIFSSYPESWPFRERVSGASMCRGQNHAVKSTALTELATISKSHGERHLEGYR